MKKQVDKSHYQFSCYMHKERWISIWHQLDEVIKLHPKCVLEIGPGSGAFLSVATKFGLNVKTLDIDPELKPDYLGSADTIPLPDGAVDVTCAFQVLEHMPFDTSMKALSEMCRISRKAVVISLPDVKTSWASTLSIPKLGVFRFVLVRPGFKPRAHKFDGEHYWEINKENYQLKRIISEIKKVTPNCLVRTFRVHENQYHRFFIIKKKCHLP